MAWRRRDGGSEDVPEGVEDLDEPSLSRKQRAKGVAARRGSIPCPASASPPKRSEVRYEASVWCIVERAIKDAKGIVNNASKEMPSGAALCFVSVRCAVLCLSVLCLLFP